VALCIDALDTSKNNRLTNGILLTLFGNWHFPFSFQSFVTIIISLIIQESKGKLKIIRKQRLVVNSSVKSHLAEVIHNLLSQLN
jgi:hypothetical protein